MVLSVYSDLWLKVPLVSLYSLLSFKRFLINIINNQSQKRWTIHFEYRTAYFVKIVNKRVNHATQVISMLEFSKWTHIWGRIFQQIVGIPMGTNCVSLLAEFFLFSEFLHTFVKIVRSKKPYHLISHSDTSIIFFPLKIQYFSDWAPLIYLKELKIKETTETAHSNVFSYLSL